jgi:hypothetical protein
MVPFVADAWATGKNSTKIGTAARVDKNCFDVLVLHCLTAQKSPPKTTAEPVIPEWPVRAGGCNGKGAGARNAKVWATRRES